PHRDTELADDRTATRRGRRGARGADNCKRVRRGGHRGRAPERGAARPVAARAPRGGVVRGRGGSGGRGGGGRRGRRGRGRGGGWIRIPAAYTGLFGMKGTYGRIPRTPDAWFRPGTVVLGCLARSVRDVARYYDVCAGYDPLDPSSLPKQHGWEANLGSHDLSGKRVAVIPDLNGVTLEPGVEAVVRNAAAD